MTTPAHKPSRYTLAIRSLTKAFKSFGYRGRFWLQGRYGLDPHTDKSFDVEEVAKVKLPHPLMMCSMGAILRADGPGEKVAIKLLAEAIVNGDDGDGDATYPDEVIINFNDDSFTTFKDIRKVFNKAIKIAERRRASEVSARRKRSRA